MTIAPDTEVYYDPYDIDIVHDPYPVYARLRDEAPIYYNDPYDFWAISRHADVEKALADWKTFSNSRSDILELVKSKFDMPPGVMMFQDPPMHTMLRGLDVTGLHPPADGGHRGPDPAVLRPMPGSPRRLRRIRHHRRAGVDDADAGHRDAVGHSRRDSRSRSATPTTRTCAPSRVGTDEGRRRRRDRRRAHLRRLRRLARQEPLRRSDDRAAQCRVRRRERGDPQS